MAKRVTTEEVERMYQLLDRIGNCADVAREIGRSASTVRYYINLRGVPKPVKPIVRRVANTKRKK